MILLKHSRLKHYFVSPFKNIFLLKLGNKRQGAEVRYILLHIYSYLSRFVKQSHLI